MLASKGSKCAKPSSFSKWWQSVTNERSCSKSNQYFAIVIQCMLYRCTIKFFMNSLHNTRLPRHCRTNNKENCKHIGIPKLPVCDKCIECTNSCGLNIHVYLLPGQVAQLWMLIVTLTIRHENQDLHNCTSGSVTVDSETNVFGCSR